MNTVVLRARHDWRRWLPRDRVWLGFAALLAGAALYAPALAVEGVRFVAENLLDIAPWLIAAILLAGWTQASGSDAVVARAFAGRAAVAVPVAALVAAVSPFCSCGVVPLVAGLLAAGVPLAPIMAFWLSSPVIDPPTFLVTVSILGLPFAIGKTAAAFLLGLLGGFGTHLFAGSRWAAAPLRPELARGRTCCGSRCGEEPEVLLAIWRDPPRLRRFARDSLEVGHLLLKWLALAFLIESLMLALVPAEVVAAAVGGGGWLPVITATVVGVPAYLNGYAALPVVAGLLEQGMAPGAAMAFLVAGGVSCVPAAVAVWAIVRPPVFAVYLAFAFAGSMLAGLGFGAIYGLLPAAF